MSGKDIHIKGDVNPYLSSPCIKEQGAAKLFLSQERRSNILWHFKQENRAFSIFINSIVTQITL